MARQRSAKRSAKAKKADIRRSARRKPAARTNRQEAEKTASARGIFAGPAAERREFRPADAVVVSQAIRRYPSRPHRRHSRRAPHQLLAILRAGAAARFRAGAAGVRPSDTVSVMLPNVPAMLEAHYGVPMLGAVLNTINTRLEAATIAYHPAAWRSQGADHRPRVRRAGGAGSGAAEEAAARHRRDDALYTGPGERLGKIDYEEFIAEGDPDFEWSPPGERKQRDRAELHVRHHRQSEGRGLSPSRHVP